MKISIVEPAFPINSRTERFFQSLEEAFGKGSVNVICWNRDGRPDSGNTNYHIFKKNVGYANRKAKLIGLKDFYSYLSAKLKQLKPDFILASHWDSLILSALVKPKNSKIIYENLDMPTGKFPVRQLLRGFERRALSKTDIITFASRFFEPHYSDFKGQRFIIENKLPKEMCISLSPRNHKDSLAISFLGVVRHAHIMENLMRAIQDLKDIEFKIFGGGPFYEQIKHISEKYERVTMYGPYNYKDVPQIYSQSDLIWAVYPYHDFNVKLAISNKYHETLYYGVPGIFCKYTELGDMVSSKKIGFAVDCDSVSDIHEVLSGILKDKNYIFNEMSRNLKKERENENSCWEDEISPFINYLKKCNEKDNARFWNPTGGYQDGSVGKGIPETS